ncbi:unnamed protein product [Acanthoscelides obtectus]|uniref:Uncharacterized protein n=1 Tax=Acanthoscelides obtectus TaxID=200917 RepID=A0A9P0KCZ1_ACAOB|nr:unnamed protein product [Acanthoscelides obtectus]CAK1669375.1 hypothetical protein AOBTE_LOCUS26978 [Acanthoscelides obtectus]
MIDDKPRSGRPSTARIDENVEIIRKLVLFGGSQETTIMHLRTQPSLFDSFGLKMAWIRCPTHLIRLTWLRALFSYFHRRKETSKDAALTTLKRSRKKRGRSYQTFLRKTSKNVSSSGSTGGCISSFEDEVTL